MDFITESRGDTLILAVSGRLASAAADPFEREVARVLACKPAVLLVDLSGLDFITSAGLRILILAAKGVWADGRRIHLCGLSAAVHDVFRVSGPVQIFPIFSGRAGALE